MKKTLLILSAIFLFFAGCRKDDVFEEGEVAYKFSVITRDVTDITSVSAKCDGAVELIAYDEEITVTARGVCWSTSQNPTINDNKTSDGSGTGSFTSNLINLNANTTYYVRAYATNEKGTSYGEQKSFKTLQNIELPTVTTTNVSNITQTTATCGGTVTSDGGANVTARGVCWSTSQNPTTDDNKTENGSGTGTYTSNLTNLTENTTYYVRAYATNEKGTSYGEEKSFTTMVNESMPVVATNEVTNITQTTATSGGTVTSDGGANVTARGVCWSTSQNPTISNSHTTDGNGTGSFTSSITGLTSNTTYYVRAYATNEKGTSYGEEKSFETVVGITMPTVTTNNVTNITTSSAVCGGNVTSDGNGTFTVRGVCWSTSQNPTIDDNKTVDGNGTGSFTSNITGLTANTTYYVRAYATNEKGTSYGEEKSFETVVGITMPTVTTNNVTNITTSSAVCGGNVTSDGNGTFTVRGVCWSTSQNPTIDDNKTVDGNGIGSFTSNITGLTANTTYYVRAYATNEKGTAYGEEKSFETVVGITMPTVTTNNVTNITTSSAVCGGNVTSDGNGTFTVRGVCWSTSQNPTIDDNKTVDGNGIGTFTSNITGLTVNTTYYVRAYATNEKGTSYGEQRSLKTNGTINGYEYVDLGLPSGLKWATCNVGASSPEDYGNYYAWGETETKSEYTESNSLTDGLSISELQSQGIIDGSGNLAPSHDAARANWGSSWRMPTKEEQLELIVNCTKTWTTQNGVKGCKFTGPNGNSIFLPAAGDREGTSLYSDGSQGYYRSSTPSVFYDDLAYGLFFYNGDEIVDDYYFYLGHTVRPITE